jgi:integrase
MEVQDFDKFLAAFPANLQPTVLFLYYSGCRVGAMEQITWAMVNNDCTEIHAPGSIIKNDSAWEIPLAGPLEPIAEALKTIRKQAAKEKKILASDAPVFDTTNFRKIWNQTCHDLKLGVYVTETEAGKPTQRYTGLHPHDFRRSSARNLIKAGVSERVAMKITGHKTNSMFHRYAIKNTDDVKEALIQVGAFKKGKEVSITAGRKAVK